MKPGVEFWFDFISPFGYLGSLRIDELAARHGRSVEWRPLLVGVPTETIAAAQSDADAAHPQGGARRRAGPSC